MYYVRALSKLAIKKDPILPVVAAMTVTTHASDAMVAIPFWLEMFAVVAASISGVLVAREHKLDLVGAVALAVVCGLGAVFYAT